MHGRRSLDTMMNTSPNCVKGVETDKALVGQSHGAGLVDMDIMILARCSGRAANWSRQMCLKI